MDEELVSRIRGQVAGMKTSGGNSFLPSGSSNTFLPQTAETQQADDAGGPPNGAYTPPAPEPPQGNVDTEHGVFYDSAPNVDASAGQTGLGGANFGGEDNVQSGTDPNAPAPELTATSDSGGQTFYGGPGGMTDNGTHSGDPSPDPLSGNDGVGGAVPDDGSAPWGGKKPTYLPNSPTMPTATQWNVTEDQTVEGRMNSLLDENNPVFDSIRETLMREHAARGGKNSLMASRAASVAVADMAFKIASQDAAVFARSAEFNAAMANQFGLAEQQFMHNAMLSEQNFRQSRILIKDQARAQMAAARASANSQMQLLDRQAQHNLDMENVQHQHQLETMDRAHGFDLENSELDYQHRFMLSEQDQAHGLEMSDRNTENAMRHDMVVSQQQFGQQLQLNYLSEIGANGRALLGTIGDIRSNPNISPAQASAGVSDAVHNFNQVNDMLRSYYGNPVPGSPQSQQQTGGGSGGTGGGGGTYDQDGNPVAGPPPSYSTPAFDYLSYGRGYSLGQGGYNTAAPTIAPFWNGTGRQRGPMYGSNTAYAAGTRPQNPPPYTPRPTQSGGGTTPPAGIPEDPRGPDYGGGTGGGNGAPPNGGSGVVGRPTQPKSVNDGGGL